MDALELLHPIPKIITHTTCTDFELFEVLGDTRFSSSSKTLFLRYFTQRYFAVYRRGEGRSQMDSIVEASFF